MPSFGKYAPYYCEENIWHLCQQKEFCDLQPQVVLISNRDRRCAVWCQRAGGPGEPVLWDYHVILLCQSGRGWQVWDMDTLLGFPEAFDKYVDSSFLSVEAGFAPEFRLLTAEQYVAVLSSDRRHMLNAKGVWLVTPPPWPQIYNGKFANLMALTDLSQPQPGEILNLDQLRARFGGSPT